jgi:hypothetical protein
MDQLDELRYQYSTSRQKGGIYAGGFTKAIGDYRNSNDEVINCDFGVIKSALQKYIRRGEIDNATKFLILGYFFNLSSETRAKGLITNLINRLRVICLEDVGIGNWRMIEILDEYLIEYYSIIGDGNLAWVKRLKCLIMIVENLSYSKKIRLVSWVKSLYDLPITNKKTKEGRHNFPYNYEPNILQHLMNKFPKLYEKNTFIDGLEKGSLSCLLEISKLYREDDNLTKKINDIWKILKEMVKCEYLEKTIDILYKWYKGVSYGNKKLSFPIGENTMPLLSAILLVIHRDSLKLEKLENRFDLNLEVIKEKIIYFCENSKNKVMIDDYILDKHTMIGKRNNKTTLDFVDEGSLVNNQYFGRYSEKEINRFQKLYYLSKLILDGTITKEILDNYFKNKLDKLPSIKNIDNTIIDGIKVYDLTNSNYIKNNLTSGILGQLVVGRNNPTYMFSDYVVKGPYLLDSQKFKLNLENVYILCILEDILDLDLKYRGYLGWDFILKNGLDYYLVNKNVGGSSFELETKQNTNDINKLEKINSGIWKIVKRGSLVDRVSDLTTISDDLGIAIVQHLYFRNIMLVGDNPIANTLVRRDGNKKLVAGIDMEERPGKIRFYQTRIDCLMPRASKAKKLFYSKYLDKIKPFNIDHFDILKDSLKYETKHEIIENIIYYNKLYK